MELTAKLLADISARKITKRAAAAKLGCSETHLNRITPYLPPGPVRAQRLANAQLAAARRAYRMKLAKEVMKKRCSIETAAKRANCTVRTIYRYIALLSD